MTPCRSSLKSLWGICWALSMRGKARKPQVGALQFLGNLMQISAGDGVFRLLATGCRFFYEGARCVGSNDATPVSLRTLVMRCTMSLRLSVETAWLRAAV